MTLSADLATNVKMASASARTTRGGAAKAAASAAPTPTAGRRSVVETPQVVNRGAGELDKIVNNKLNNIKQNNNISNNNSDSSGSLPAVAAVAAAAAATAAAAAASGVPSAATVALAYSYYREQRTNNNGVALIPRFECPAPPALRCSAQMHQPWGGASAAGDGDATGDGEEGEEGGSSGGQSAAAAVHAGDTYLFVLGEQAVGPASCLIYTLRGPGRHPGASSYTRKRLYLSLLPDVARTVTQGILNPCFWNQVGIRIH